MSTYCEGSDCSKRDNENYQAVIEHSCGDKGNFKQFTPLTKTND